MFLNITHPIIYRVISSYIRQCSFLHITITLHHVTPTICYSLYSCCFIDNYFKHVSSSNTRTRYKHTNVVLKCLDRHILVIITTISNGATSSPGNYIAIKYITVRICLQYTNIIVSRRPIVVAKLYMNHLSIVVISIFSSIFICFSLRC